MTKMATSKTKVKAAPKPKKVKEGLSDGLSDRMSDILKALNMEEDDLFGTGDEIIRKEKDSTGSLTLDHTLDGGYIKGKIIECFGPESVGKSALAFSFIAALQKKGGIVGFIDAESALDRETVEMYGVDVKRLVPKQPDYLEEGMELMLKMVESGCDAVVFDSVAGLPPKKEFEGTMDDHAVGSKASRMGQLMRKLHKLADVKGCTIFFVNQIRDSMQMYGDPITTPGGKGLKFHASYRLQVTGTESIPKTGEPIGHLIKMTIKKNKFGPPKGKIEIPLIYGLGICREWELIDLAVEKGIVKKAGTWFDYEGTKVGQGQYASATFLIDNPELYDEILNKVKA